MSAARAAGSIAGCAHTNISFRRSSGNCGLGRRRELAEDDRERRLRAASTRPRRQRSCRRRRAAVSSHASGAAGTPSTGQWTSAAAKASPSASSAPAMSCERAHEVGDEAAVRVARDGRGRILGRARAAMSSALRRRRQHRSHLDAAARRARARAAHDSAVSRSARR
jgi:hypothetical protein